MHYTPGQLRQTVGLSKEAFRHWKRVLPAFSGGRGHAPSFSPGDVLASAVLRRLTESCGVRIGHLTDVASKIFEICNQTSWEVLADRILVLDLSEQECLTVRTSDRIPVDSTVVVCPLGPAIAELRDSFLRSSRSHVRNPLSSTAGSDQDSAAEGHRP
jgi:hypothetical protein